MKPQEDFIPSQFEDAPVTENKKDQDNQEEVAENQDALDISYNSTILLMSSDDIVYSTLQCL